MNPVNTPEGAIPAGAGTESLPSRFSRVTLWTDATRGEATGGVTRRTWGDLWPRSLRQREDLDDSCVGGPPIPERDTPPPASHPIEKNSRMGLVTTHPRLEEPGVPPEPLFRDGRAPGRLAPIVLLFAILPAVMAVADDRLGLRLVMASLVIVICSAAVVAVVRSRTMTTGVVRFHDTSRSLLLRPPASPSVAVVVLLILLLLPAVAQGATDISGSKRCRLSS